MNRKERRMTTRGNRDARAASLIAAAQGHLVGGRFVEASATYRQALKISPDHADALIGLGFLHHLQNDNAAAERLLRNAVKKHRGASRAHYALGVVLADTTSHHAAIESFRESLRLDPNNVECRFQLGNSLVEVGCCAEAARHFRAVIEAEPKNIGAYNNLGMALQQQYRIADAIEAFGESIRRKPDYQSGHSNLLLGLNYSSTHSAGDVFDAHVRWGRNLPAWPASPPADEPENPAGERLLRIGYVSPDFRRHSVAYFLEPLLENHDRTKVEVFCYAEVRRPDDVTTRLRALATHWYSTVDVPDEIVAKKIRDDRIDVLIDLAGHTRHNRLLVFARRPAPVQATWLGYPNTSGLEAMNYRLVDETTDPAGIAERFMTETPIRLSGGFLCYRPSEDAPDVVDPPCVATGHITFSSFNNLAKVSPALVKLWAGVLKQVPRSRLLIKSKSFADSEICELFRRAFEDVGIGRERLDLIDWVRSTTGHLDTYRAVDIALDTYPYNGTTTTCEALWSGVPVVTLAGDRHAARVGASILSQIGCLEWIAKDEAGYVEIACKLAGNVDGLKALRHRLRDAMRSSKLLDGRAFASRMEDAFRTMVELNRLPVRE